jgi:hypothetical protein
VRTVVERIEQGRDPALQVGVLHGQLDHDFVMLPQPSAS